MATESGSPTTYRSGARDVNVQPAQAEAAECSTRTSTETHCTEEPLEVAKEHAASAHAANVRARKALRRKAAPSQHGSSN